MILDNDLRVNLHDLFRVYLLRLVSPEELVTFLSNKLNLKIKVEGFGHEEGRIDYCRFIINKHQIYYQVCGLFAGDEFFLFKKDTPKEVVDVVLAVWELKAAERLREHFQTEHKIVVEDKEIEVITPEELVAKIDKQEALKLHLEREICINDAINEAKQVLSGQKSFFDEKLKDYKPRKTLGESLLEMANLSRTIRRTVETKLKDKKEVEKFLTIEYLNWSLQLTGFEAIYKSFEDKVKRCLEGLLTAQNRGWLLTKKYKKEIEYYKQALQDKTLITNAIKSGSKLITEIKKQIQQENKMVSW